MTIFSRSADLPPLKADRLLGLASQYFPGGALPSDDELWGKLLAEESALEVRCRTLFGVREVYSTGTPQVELDALPVNSVLLEEPGYDFDPGLMYGGPWPRIDLRHKPIVQIRSVTFAFPGQSGTLYTIPPAWVRAEKKYGRIDIVPSTSGGVVFPASAYALSALSGGRTIPFGIRVNYQAGMPDIRTARPDIVDAIRRLTVLSVLDDQFFPTSDSSSVDGLSQSLGMDTAKFRDITDKRLTAIEQSLNGIRFIAL